MHTHTNIQLKLFDELVNEQKRHIWKKKTTAENINNCNEFTIIDERKYEWTNRPTENCIRTNATEMESNCDKIILCVCLSLTRCVCLAGREKEIETEKANDWH